MGSASNRSGSATQLRMDSSHVLVPTRLTMTTKYVLAKKENLDFRNVSFKVEPYVQYIVHLYSTVCTSTYRLVG